MVRSVEPANLFDSRALYDAIAPSFDADFDGAPHRRAYEQLAWERVSQLLPSSPGGLVVDAGCGTGRWVERLLSLGHSVLGIEQSTGMLNALQKRNFGPRFSLVAGGMEEITVASGSADAVLAIGSVQYTQDPARILKRFGGWTKPGGVVCVLADSRAGLVNELLNAGRTEEAGERSRTRRAIWQHGAAVADMHLFDRRTLEGYFAEAGLSEIQVVGLLITVSSWGRERMLEAATKDWDSFLALERSLQVDDSLVDCGKQLLVTGRRPVT